MDKSEESQPPKNPDAGGIPVPNNYLFDNFTRSLAILNFMILSEILSEMGKVENKKQFRKDIVNQWLNNMKLYLNGNINSYSKKERKLHKINKFYGIKSKMISTEEIQSNTNKNLSDFKKFLDSVVVNRELYEGNDG